ncbi:tRNA-dependent cyclodipeptide synthase [Motilimonas sp. KMU-193]|uniref:tRNA-dependent cyclodipeptide synthase n=1 Tax=Motilimonas sp. KMU-193 TaxID=3388668 RepID=UPI00396AF2F8
MANETASPFSTSDHSFRYKAEVRLVSPASARGTSNHNTKCFVGISLESPVFIGHKLQSIIDFVSNRYSDCCFLLGDHVHRLTLQMNNDFTREESFNHAINLGNSFLSSQGHILRNSKTGKPFDLVRGSEIYHLPEVLGYLSVLKTIFEQDIEFRSAVEHFADQFIARQHIVQPNRAIQLSSEYVLEELAETCYMISSGYETLVYPGSLAIFQQISDKKFSDLPVELDKLVNVSLRIKRRGKKMQLQCA